MEKELRNCMNNLEKTNAVHLNTEELQQKKKRKNLDYIDYFRAIAIIFIVAEHTLCWGHSTMYEFNRLLFVGGTYFFVFIAGFLFQYLSDNFNVKTYFKKKFLNVICPWMITLLPVAFLYSYKNIDAWYLQFVSFKFRFVTTMMNGYIVNGPLWFMGMISIIFLVSPLLLYVRRKNLTVWVGLLGASLICSITIPRFVSHYTFLPFDPHAMSFWKIFVANIVFYFKSFYHFLFFYLMGMEMCILIQKYGDWINIHLKQIFKVSLFLYLFHFILQLFIVKSNVNICLISKTIELFVILSGLMIIEDKIRSNVFMNKFLKIFAQYSFGIFFIHNWFLNYVYTHQIFATRGPVTPLLIIYKNTFPCFLNSIKLFLITLFGSLLFLWIVKTILNMIGFKKTRMIIGV